VIIKKPFNSVIYAVTYTKTYYENSKYKKRSIVSFLGWNSNNNNYDNNNFFNSIIIIIIVIVIVVILN